jgi:hypothetical protein
MNSPQNKIFVFFKILANTLWNLQTCCKIQKSKKIFFVFKKSMLKHIFLNFEYFFLKKRKFKRSGFKLAWNWSSNFKHLAIVSLQTRAKILLTTGFPAVTLDIQTGIS